MKNNILQLRFLTLITLATVAFKTNAQTNWTLTGNSNINATTNFLGTTNNKALLIKTNGVERMRVTGNGKFGIGEKKPETLLHVNGTTAVSLSSPGLVMLGDIKAYNIAMDKWNIQARYNGGASSLNLNTYGGIVYAGNYANSSYGLIGAGIYEGVYGYTYDSSGIGVYGWSQYYHGVYGYTGGGTNGSDPNYPAAVHGYNSGYGNGVTGYCVKATGVVGWSDEYVGVWGHTGNANSWAGFFAGNVYSTGTYQGSDEKLKQNIKDFSSAMDIIKQLHPKSYQFRQDGNYKSMNLPQGLHYGLIAQDVEKTLPGLVKETKQDVTKTVQRTTTDPKDATKQVTVRDIVKTGESIDFKAVNYTELIPIMIKGMQEQQSIIDRQQSVIERQQQQIDELKQMMQNVTAANSSDARSAEAVGAYLIQNAPNPFSESTTVKCYVPSSVKQAQLAIYSMKGQLLKSYKLSSGENNLSIAGGTLASGQYTYSLLADGKKVDSKSMIITK